MYETSQGNGSFGGTPNKGNNGSFGNSPINDSFVSLPLLRNINSGRIAGWEHLPRLTPSDVDGPACGYPGRWTVGAIGNTVNLLSQFTLPVSALFTPLMQCSTPPVRYILRCGSCKAYISCYSQWSGDGRSWRCHLCGASQVTPSAYVSPLCPQTGQREDIDERPELKYASVEFLATADYGNRPVQPPCIVFLLDVSFVSVTSGMLVSSLESIRQWALSPSRRPSIVRYGVITYDRVVTLYHTSPALRVVVLPEQCIDDVPVIDGIALEPRRHGIRHEQVLSPLDSEQALSTFTSILDLIWETAQNTKCAEGCFGAALITCMQMLDGTGGKVMAFVGSGRSFGFPAPENMNTFYMERGIVCNHRQISVDIHTLALGGGAGTKSQLVTPEEHRALGTVCRMTSGRYKTYSNTSQMQKELGPYLNMVRGYESILRVRSTRGVKITTTYGGCYVKTPDLVALPILDEMSTYACNLALQHDLTVDHIFLQGTIMYTSEEGQRKLRVHNIALPVVRSVIPMYASVDVAAMAASLFRPMVDDMLHDPSYDVYASLNSLLEGSLARFRSQCLSSGQRGPAGGPLLLPKKMQCLPQLVCGFYRSMACCPTHPLRMSLCSDLLSSPVQHNTALLCPISFGLYHPQRSQQQIRVVPTSAAYLSEDALSYQCVTVIDAVTSVVLVIGRDAPKPVLMQMFGTENLAEIKRLKDIPIRSPTLSPTLSPKLNGNEAIRALLADRPGAELQVGVIPQDIPSLAPYFCEDVQRQGVESGLKVAEGMKGLLNYVSYLVQLKGRQTQ